MKKHLIFVLIILKVSIISNIYAKQVEYLEILGKEKEFLTCLLYTSPSPRD